MGYHEAVKDGIKMGRDSRGFSVYYPLCGICGQPTYSPTYLSHHNYTCRECKESATIDAIEYAAEVRVETKTKKLDEAIKRISRVADIDKYQRGIEWITNNLDKPFWFESTEEIMVALELIKCGIKANHQVKVLKFRVDFVLPEEKIILEIDGVPFHGKDRKGYEQERDKAIISTFGDEWDVIRISTDHINKNITKLIAAVKAMKNGRQRYRKSFNGTLPIWYSDTVVRKR